MPDEFTLPGPSLAERDRRWATVREQMARRGFDYLLLMGFPYRWDFATGNARYLCPVGGNSEFNVLIFPLEGEPVCLVGMPTFVPYWELAQSWVADVRPRRGSWAATIAAVFEERGWEGGTVGCDGLSGALDADGWFPHQTLMRLRELLPRFELVNSNDLMEEARTIKSAEEIDLLRQAARLGDRMLEVCRDSARPGVPEMVVFAKMREVMLAEGGEEPTLLLWAADARPFPHPFRVPRPRSLANGDLILCEIHPKYAGYCTHVERTFSLGEPAEEYRRIYEGCLQVFDAGVAAFGPGVPLGHAMKGVHERMTSLGLDYCELGIHGHGLNSLEYPRFRFHASTADQGLDASDELRPGMVFAFNVDLVDPQWEQGRTGTVFADTILVTDDGVETLHAFPRDLATVP